MPDDLLLQAAKAAAYYGGLLVLVRLAGKRMAGQTTTFDLIILIALGVVLQSAALQDGAGNAVVFVLTVFALHRLTAMLCAHSRFVRHVVRGKPRPLVRDGHVIAVPSSSKALPTPSSSPDFASSVTTGRTT